MISWICIKIFTQRVILFPFCNIKTFKLQEKKEKKTINFSIAIIFRVPTQTQHQGPAQCSKLTMSLINDLLKFQMAILQILCYFLLKNVRILCKSKDSHIFFNKK